MKLFSSMRPPIKEAGAQDWVCGVRSSTIVHVPYVYLVVSSMCSRCVYMDQFPRLSC